MTRFIATVGGVGLIPGMPGTWGSLAALPLAYLLHLAGGPWLLMIGTGLTFLLGWWATMRETASGDPDPSEIVIDEVVGQWIALLPVSFGAAASQVDPTQLWPGLIAAFILFRVFDILKPGPVAWADRKHTPLGVMLDDVIAGLLGAMSVGGLAWIAHMVLGVV